MKNILTLILNALYPIKCICCGETGGNRAICEKCLEKLNKKAGSECQFCKFTPNLCNCRKILYIDAIFYKYFYIGDELKKAISMYKRANLYYINEFFAKDMFTLIEKSDKINMGDINFITNVPRKEKSVNNFGYDQTKNLSREIGKYSGIKYKSLLRVVKNYREQKGLNRKERLLNVKNKFIPMNKDFISGKNILLIDDIVTTGSTLSECARVLKNTGAKKIYALCIASSNFPLYIKDKK